MAFIAGVRRVSGLALHGGPVGILGLFMGGGPVIPLEFTVPVAGPVTADLDSCLPQACQAENDNIQIRVFVVDQDGDPVNLLGASAKTFLILRPDGTTFERSAGFLTSGVDGGLYYNTDDDDLVQSGTYQVQARYTIGGKTQTTRRVKFRVGANIEE